MTLSPPGLDAYDTAREQTRVQERHARCMAVVAFLLFLGASLAFQ